LDRVGGEQIKTRQQSVTILLCVSVIRVIELYVESANDVIRRRWRSYKLEDEDG
jgi:hypothetical protein